MGIGELDREAHVPGGTGAAAAPRTLAEALRARGDEGLAALLRARPDLLSPVPNDLTQLATRAGTRGSVVRALERLDRFTLQTAEALAVAPDPAPYPVLLGLLSGDDGDPDIEAALPRAVEVLREQALIWGDEDRLRLVRTARELLAPSPQHPSPTGLGPTVAEATAGMSPGRIQEIIATAGLPATHDPVSAVAALTELFTDRDRMGALLDTAPPEALAVLDRLVWGPPYGEVTANPAPPVRWLRDRGLLLPASPRTVVLPREAALHLRGGRAHRAPEPHAPELTVLREYRPQVVDNAAAGQASTALATVEELLKGWDQGGPAVLRAGGLSVRDLKRTAVALDVAEPVAAFWLELCHGAGLLASDGEADERYAPTPAYDDWLDLPPAERWARLVTSWMVGTRTAGLVGGQDAKGRTLSALGPDLDRGAAPEVRRRVLTLQATLPPGSAADPEALLARLRWERPLRGGAGGAGAVASGGAGAGTRTGSAAGTGAGTAYGAGAGTGTGAGPGTAYGTGAGAGAGTAYGTGAGAGAGTAYGQGASGATADLRSRIAVWTLTEAEMLGVTGRGALASPARALLNLPLAEAATEPVAVHGVELSVAASRAATLLAPLLPEPVDHVLLQADLTAVAPGPLRRPLADMLSVLADVESKGGATVFRFTPGSVRRALDAGRSASDLHDFLSAHSRTPVPQPLAYLIDDVARKHGHLRIGAASAYVRCDDDALLGEILADKRSASLRLRRLAPTVLAAQTDPAALLDGLRSMGYAPAAESSEGDVLITRADAYRTGPRTAPAPVPEGPPAPDTTLLAAAVRAIRAGDLASTAVRKERPEGRPLAGGELPRTSPAETLATVQAAAMTGSAVWIGYVNAEGAASQRVIAPVRVEGGFVTGYDHTADEVRTYPLHRITGVAELADDQV
ncbi:helicase C-terminal domain-containing protein [Streptomyces vilmorinianum]|uniref:helicase C-terminal domain-containing protein n=1 Tax=Streptomyces vilmorinianum TaxID=3051092 RepID=UPI0010FB9C14|nr:helicase C-terminal domain-containing protein [Streptomyces vilmorinianum]